MPCRAVPWDYLYDKLIAASQSRFGSKKTKSSNRFYSLMFQMQVCVITVALIS